MSSGHSARWTAVTPVTSAAAVTAAAAVAAVAIRLARSRHRRSLHPLGHSFTGELRIQGSNRPRGAALLDQAASYPVTLRVSKALGTPGDLPDIRGLAIRVHLPGRDLDLLLDSVGRRLRRLPLPRRSFNVPYGTVTAYRTGSGVKLYVMAEPAPDHSVGAGGRIILKAEHLPPAPRPRPSLPVRERTSGNARGAAETSGVLLIGEVLVERPLPASEDAALAFDPVRNSLPDLHPTGYVHGVRAFAYRWSQHWRGAAPAAPNRAAIARAAEQR